MLILKYIYVRNYKPVPKIDNVNNTLDDNIAISLEKQNIKLITINGMSYVLQIVE